MKQLFFFLFFFLISQHNFAQHKSNFLSDPNDIALMDSADFFYQEKAYLIAGDYYKQLLQKFPEEKILWFKTAVCYVMSPYHNDSAAVYFEKFTPEYFKKDHSEYYFALNLMYNEHYEEAIRYFKQYQSQKYALKEFKQACAIRIKNCETILTHQTQENNISISHPENNLNSIYSETRPCISYSGQLFFSYAGKNSQGGLQASRSLNSEKTEFYEDVFVSTQTGNNFSAPSPLNGEVNTNAAEPLLFVTPDAQHLYLLQQEASAFIAESKLDDREWERKIKLYGKINSPWNQTGISVSADGKTAVYSSDKPGGRGGSDLYVAHLQKDGSWSEGILLDTNINTLSNEQSPFLHPSGKYLFFSSDRQNGFGGYDIYRCHLTADSSWSQPENLGLPLNSVYDEKYFSLNTKGNLLYFSGYRKGSTGREDIFIAAGNFTPENPLTVLHGIITVDEAPLRGEITVMFSDGRHQGNYYSNAANGKYVIPFLPDQQVRLIVNVNGQSPKELFFSTAGRTFYSDSLINIEFYSGEYLAAHPEKNNQENNPVQDIVKKPKTIYYVQIGAFKKGGEKTFSRLNRFGKVQQKNYNDGWIRYVIGDFGSYEEAVKIIPELSKLGYSSCFVTAELEGKRISVP